MSGPAGLNGPAGFYGVEGGIGAAIRAELEGFILGGSWAVGMRIPTELELAARYGCARMTVHTALAGLAARGLIVRRRRAGSFVAAPPPEHAVMTIGDFADEAARSGRVYRHEIAALSRGTADGMAGFAAGAAVVRVACRHLFDAVPVAWEDRVIRVGAVPGVARATFQAEPPGRWLLRHVPWSRAEHEITAVGADAAMAVRLRVRRGAALLCLHRRTWHEGLIVTDVRLAFAGTRYRLGGSITPG